MTDTKTGPLAQVTAELAAINDEIQRGMTEVQARLLVLVNKAEAALKAAVTLAAAVQDRQRDEAHATLQKALTA